MTNKLFAVLTGLFLLGILPGVSRTSINLIPFPAKMIQGDGCFMLSSETKIFYDDELKSIKGFYNELLESNLGFSLNETKRDKASIVLKVDKKIALPEEGYYLNVTNEKVEILSTSPKGIFYGIQSINQLISVEAATKRASLPIVNIEDYPRFGYRGCMLDVSRTFIHTEQLKKYIDLMSHYKLNVLHWHLIDDQGWRIEIKRYPRLTSIGSKFDPEFNEMGGYYSQEDVREIIQYAALRNITVIPEFELPGHECAAIASYPELSCRGVRPKIHPFMMGPDIHKEIFCAGKPETYEFIFNVLDEITTLFPSQYIHIGGDEAPKSEWKKCSYCQKTIRENHLENEEELQSYFTTKINDYLAQKGKTLIGWDEILEGGNLKGDEVIMFWRSWIGDKIKKSAQQGFKIISCPTSHCYFDYSYESINTKKVYLYEPIPDNISSDIIENYIGVQANFWSHIDRCEDRIDKQLFPRLFALSEVGWSFPQNKEWSRFKNIARKHCEKLREKQINCYYDKSIYNPE